MSFIVLIFQIADRGVSYIYGIFYRFELIDVPDKVKERGCGRWNLLLKVLDKGKNASPHSPFRQFML